MSTTWTDRGDGELAGDCPTSGMTSPRSFCPLFLRSSIIAKTDDCRAWSSSTTDATAGEWTELTDDDLALDRSNGDGLLVE
jgi:hypothetical protein